MLNAKLNFTKGYCTEEKGQLGCGNYPLITLGSSLWRVNSEIVPKVSKKVIRQSKLSDPYCRLVQWLAGYSSAGKITRIQLCCSPVNNPVHP